MEKGPPHDKSKRDKAFLHYKLNNKQFYPFKFCEIEKLEVKYVTLKGFGFFCFVAYFVISNFLKE